MDRIKETAHLIIELNKYKKGQLEDFNFIRSVCGYFDKIKTEVLTEKDFKFLKFVATSSGIPHFYNILNQFNQQPNIDSFDLSTFSSLFYESILHTDEKNMLHRYQKQIIDGFEKNRLNRFFLSASTSFGKTHLVFEVIKKMEYQNIVLIFPTIALLSENLEKVISDGNYLDLHENYSVHTLSKVTVLGERNLFIYTPERFLSFIENSQHDLAFDFVFVDEVYKIDNDYLIDEELRENERDVAYRLAVFYALQNNTDVLLAGPYMDFDSPESPTYNNSFDNFLQENSISLIDYNNYEIVNKSFLGVKRARIFPIDNQLNIHYSNGRKTDRLLETIDAIISIRQNLIVYCARKNGNGGVEYYANSIINSGILENHDSSNYEDIISHIEDNFTREWILVKALKQGVGIHHGLVPKYIQKEIINLFNNGWLKVLISTTTITEGVNTSAKNLIVMHSKKGNKELKKFDAKNIAGRAGRFGYHYSGRVIDLSGEFKRVIEGNADIIKHKNYDIQASKDEIDLFYSDEKYLSQIDKQRKDRIRIEQQRRNIPEEIITQYKVISRKDKIRIYDSISRLSDGELILIKRLIRIINYKLDVNYAGFQVVLDVIEPIVTNQKLKFLIEYKGESGEDYSMLTNLIHFYLVGGFKSSIRYHHRVRGASIDEAVRKTSEFVYNTLKYQTVKYLGVFNLMYKYFISENSITKFEDVIGIDLLLLKFEYNALTDEGRIASDYGVPSSIVDYYENTESQNEIKAGFDNYELNLFNKIDKIIKNE
jgi:hypothetical protein